MKIEVIDDNTVTVNGEVFKKEKTEDGKTEPIKFEKGNKYKSNSGNIVLCTYYFGKDEDHFSGVTLELGDYAKGHFSDSWIKSKFTSYNEPVTI